MLSFGLKFDRLLFFFGGGVAQNEGYSSGVEEKSIIFWVDKKFALFYWGY